MKQKDQRDQTDQNEHFEKATQTVISAITEALGRDDLTPLSFPSPERDGVDMAALDAAIVAAFHARQQIVNKAMGLKLMPLGYYIPDADISDDNDLVRVPEGGIVVTPY